MLNRHVYHLSGLGFFRFNNWKCNVLTYHQAGLESMIMVGAEWLELAIVVVIAVGGWFQKILLFLLLFLRFEGRIDLVLVWSFLSSWLAILFRDFFDELVVNFVIVINIIALDRACYFLRFIYRLSLGWRVSSTRQISLNMNLWSKLYWLIGHLLPYYFRFWLLRSGNGMINSSCLIIVLNFRIYRLIVRIDSIMLSMLR